MTLNLYNIVSKKIFLSHLSMFHLYIPWICHSSAIFVYLIPLRVSLFIHDQDHPRHSLPLSSIACVKQHFHRSHDQRRLSWFNNTSDSLRPVCTRINQGYRGYLWERGAMFAWEASCPQPICPALNQLQHFREADLPSLITSLAISGAGREIRAISCRLRTRGWEWHAGWPVWPMKRRQSDNCDACSPS